MPLITETYYLSLTQDNRGILRLRCSQNDTLRTVNLKLYNNGSIFTIPSGISAYVSGVKQNGVVFSKSCTISQDRKSVILQLSSNITNVDGIIVAEIVLNDGEGERLGTSNFIIQVEKNPIRAGVVQDTETPIEYINDFIEKIQTLTARLNNLITPNGDASLAEVIDARIGILDSTTYQTLGARLNAEFQRLSNALKGVTILKSTGDTTDRTSEILSKLNAYGACKLGKGDFYVKNLVMPEDSMLIGSGNATRIVLLGSETNTYIVKPKSGCIIENISFDGGFTGTYSELIANSDARRHCIILDKFNDVNSENVILSNIFISNFVGSAIVQRATNGCHCKDVIINMCYAGIDISNASYDGQCTNISMTNTRYGVVQNGSNFVFTNCISKDSKHHIMSDQQNTECTFSSCTFFDSSLETTSVLAYLSNARNGFVFDNCMFDSSLKMGLNACDGIVIKGTNFVGSDTFKIIVSNGRNTLLLITDCIADAEPVVTNAGTAARITSCYLKDGTAWSISEADITVDDELSDKSENPVQNKVINRAIGEIKADLFNAIVKYSSYDVLADATHESRELYGITWTWDETNTVCTAVGTATARSRSRFFVSNTTIPDWIKPGKTYHIKIQSTGTAPAFYLAYYQNGSLTYERNYRTDAVITIPSDITGFIAVLQVASGYSVNGTISVQMLQGESNEALYDDFMTVDGIGNANAKMRSFGNSILTGSVWQNGSGVGLVEYDDVPYGQIAKALNIPKDNVTHTLISSTGLIYDAGSGSFLDNIKNTNLSGYDYLLTMFWTTDLEHTYSLGTIDDTASDQTLAGAVVDLVTYMYTSNGNCQLILVSVPPVSYTHAGDNVFTDLYANGFSIHDLDVLMRQMARKYHFIFLDWEQMALSYYYQNYTDGDNVHANNAVTYRVMGEYLGRCLRYLQDIPKNKELKYNSYNILDYVGQYNSRSLHGVTFTWNSEHTECMANGTADGGRAYVNIYNNSSAMPDGINPGSKYNVTFTTTDVKFALVFGLYDTLGSHNEDKVFRSDGVLEIPDGCGGMYIRLFVDNGRSVTNAVASNIALFNADTNYQLSQDVAQIYGIETGYDVLTRYGNFTDLTFRGITFTWSGRQCHVSGTADGGEAYCNIYYGLLPDGMMPGDLYRIRYESTTGRIGVHWYFYDGSGTLISDAAGSSDMEMRVPVGASMWLIRIYVRNGVTIDGYLTRLQVVKMKPLEMDIPIIVSFVDDDTTTDELVTKFHDACCHNGVKGNYAVITKNVEDGNTSASKLVAYEDEGFGLLIHCYKQYYPSDSPWNPEGGVRTEAQTNACRANLAKGIRQMIDMGLLNYDYWITPGGHMEPDLIGVAKQLSLKCLISTNNGRENNMTDFDKWFIKRVSFGATDTPASSSMAGIKALIDEVAGRGKGWLIITTHFNDGWSSLTWDDTLDENGYPVGYSRFNEMVQYAIGKGIVPMSIPQAWEYYAPILEANRSECNQANAT